MGWFNKSSGNATRDAASRLGFSVSGVERQIPKFDRSNRLQSLDAGRCVRYALPRTSSGPGWELLQRGQEDGGQLPNGYLLTPENPGAKLMGALRAIATDFSEEYFEFEGTTSDVAAYWEEWGGAAQAERLHGALMSVKDI